MKTSNVSITLKEKNKLRIQEEENIAFEFNYCILKNKVSILKLLSFWQNNLNVYKLFGCHDTGVLILVISVLKKNTKIKSFHIQ